MATTNITGNVGNMTLPGGGIWTTAPANTVNVFGATEGTLTAPATSHDAINLEPGSIFTGGIDRGPFFTTIDLTGKHGDGAWWDNNTTSNFAGTIGVPTIVGRGTILAYTSKYGGGIQFLHGTTVGSGQTVGIDGDSFRHKPGNVEVQDPSLFHAAVQLGYGQLELDGLHGTSATLKNDLLSIFNGKTAVETLRLAETQSFYPVIVSQNAGGITIHSDGADYHGGGVTLPLHG